ncbi:MAG: amino acid permease [Reichenbachiella sp.]
MSNFNRVLGAWDIFSLSFGAMIGWGWVVLTGTWINEAGVLGAVLAFFIGGLVVLLVGLTYAELTSAMPKVGGEHVFSFAGLGLNASFICTWFIILGYVSVCAFEAVALPVVMENIFPMNHGIPFWTFNGNPIYFGWIGIGCFGAAVIGTINYFGIKTASLVQILFTALILIVGLMLIIGGIFFPPTNLDSIQLFDASKISISMVTVLVMTPFMFVGFDVIPQVAEEINLPFKQIGKILVGSVLMAVLWYVGIIYSVGNSISRQEILHEAIAPAHAMGKIYMGTWAKKLLLVAGLAGIITSWNSFFVGATRAIYAMGNSNMLPRSFGLLHPKYKTPQTAIVFVTFLSMLATLFGKEALGWLVNAGGLGIVISWSLVALSFYQLRKKSPLMRRPFKVSFGKGIGLAAFFCSLGLIYLYLPGNPSSLNGIEWTIVILWLLLGLILYLWSTGKYGKLLINKKMKQHANHE